MNCLVEIQTQCDRCHRCGFFGGLRNRTRERKIENSFFLEWELLGPLSRNSTICALAPVLRQSDILCDQSTRHSGNETSEQILRCLPSGESKTKVKLPVFYSSFYLAAVMLLVILPVIEKKLDEKRSANKLFNAFPRVNQRRK